ncbi:MAG: 4Fe-4S binding protein [Actinomycetota bacterium]|jgi:ferredoxin|nr:4Fe-4S binding protein [Actinomycetota bacterium]
MTATSLRLGDWTVAVDGRCTACGACLATCPSGALLPAPLRPVVVPGRCTGCGECVEICPRGAIAEIPLPDMEGAR